MVDERRYNNNNKIKLLIVDCPITHYRAEYIGRANLSESHQRLYRFMRLLLRIAQTYEMAVVVTNQIHTTPDSTIFYTDKPLGGNVMAQTSTYIAYMRINKLKHTAKLMASPYHKQAYADFHITEKGIEDC
jgi:DNA repair protein RadA